MTNLNGNIGTFVKNSVHDNKRDQLLPKAKQKLKHPQQRPGPAPLRSSLEHHVSTKLMLPESLKSEIDLFFVKTKAKGKNEFFIEAIRKHLTSQPKGWRD